jgi:hypothetical protein
MIFHISINLMYNIASKQIFVFFFFLWQTLSQTTYMQYANSSTYPSTRVQFQPSHAPFLHGGPYPPQGQLSSNPFLPQPNTVPYIQQPNIHYASSNDQWRTTATRSSTEGHSVNDSSGWVESVGSTSGSVLAPISYEGMLWFSF